MDGIERVQARIVDVQSRCAQFSGVATTVRPTTSASTGTTATSSAGDLSSALAALGITSSGSSGTSSFADIAASFGLSASDLSALSTRATTGATGRNATATARTPGTYGSVVLPAELTGQRNGELPNSLLESIGQDGHRLTKSAAVAFRKMAAAARQDGITLTVSDSYRPIAEQERLAGTLGLYRDGGLAAVPGTSTHGWGLSVDIDVDDRASTWLRANAASFGFAEDVAREPWHYTYRPADL